MIMTNKSTLKKDKALTVLKKAPPIAFAGLEPQLVAAYNLPVLSAEKEHALAKRYYENKDLQAAELLVKHNLRHVIYVAYRYNGYGLPLSDLIQEGAIGLMKAVKRFDPSVKVRLITFAIHWIKAEIHEYVIKNWRMVKVATTKAQRKLFFRLRSMKNAQTAVMDREETQHIADQLGLKYGDVVEMEKRLNGMDIPFDAPVDDADGDSDALAPVDYLAIENADPATLEENADWQKYRGEKIRAAIESLDKRSREIIVARRLNKKKATLHELAGKYGLSAERIRQLENEAFDRLRIAITAT